MSESCMKRNNQQKKRVLVFCHGVEDVLEDHVAAGVAEPGTLFLLLDECKEREAHVHARHMAEHLLELDLLCMHEECVGDLGRTEFLALPAVHAIWANRMRWNMKFGGSCPGVTYAGFFVVQSTQ